MALIKILLIILFLLSLHDRTKIVGSNRHYEFFGHHRNDQKDDQTPKSAAEEQPDSGDKQLEQHSKNQSNQTEAFKPKTDCIRKGDRIENLNNLMVNLRQFYEQTLGQLLVLRLPDIFRIACSNDELAKQDLNTLILLLLGSAVQCDRKEYFIEKIKQLDLDDQHEIVACIQQITDNPISVWSINEWSDLNLLPQSEHEKMFNLLFLHVQSLVSERDQLLARLVSIVLKIEKLSKQCNCGQSRNSELDDELMSLLSLAASAETGRRRDAPAEQSNYSIINNINNINLANLTINQSFSTPSKFSCGKLDSTAPPNVSNRSLLTCPNCRALSLSDLSSSSKLEKKVELEDSSLTSLPSLTKEDEERNLKLKQTIEELNDFKQRLRTVQAELEEKREMLVELKELLEQSKETCVRLREENIELAQEARAIKAYRDEIDILTEKVRTFHHLENELQKYKLKMNEFDFYKARVDELRDENRLLSEAKQMLEEQLEISRKKTENLSEVESQLYQMKAYSSELKTQRELDKDKIQSLIEQIAELQVEKKSTIEELSVCQSELKHLRSQLSNSQIYLNDYKATGNSAGSSEKEKHRSTKPTECSNECSEENSLELMQMITDTGSLEANEKNLRSSLLEQLNSDASKRILKLELENQKLKFIIENLRTNNPNPLNGTTSPNDELNGTERQKHSSISSLGSAHSDESTANNKTITNQINDHRLGERCSSNSSTDSIKSTSLSVFSSATGDANSTSASQAATNQFSTSTSPLDTNEYDSGCVSLICESNKSSSITPVNMLRMQKQQLQLDKERLEQQMLDINTANSNESSKANNAPIRQQSANEQLTNPASGSQSINQTGAVDLNGAPHLLSGSNNYNHRTSSESSSNCDDEHHHQLSKLRLFDGSNSSLSSNASSVGLKQFASQHSQRTDLNKLNNNYLSNLNSSISSTKNRPSTISGDQIKQIKQIDVKRMPLIETTQIEVGLTFEVSNFLSWF